MLDKKSTAELFEKFGMTLSGEELRLVFKRH